MPTSKRPLLVKSKSKTVKHGKERIFKKKDYISGDGMMTTVWGPPMWHFLHTMSFNYPVNPTPEDKRHYKEFILNLRNVLPCKYCRQNLTNNLVAEPITDASMASRDSFSRFVYKLHEMVNKLLGKNSGLSYCDVRERYEHFRSRCTDEKPKVFSVEYNKQALKTSKKLKEKGCTEPLYGKKAKCVINIIPQEASDVTNKKKKESIQIDPQCIKTRS